MKIGKEHKRHTLYTEITAYFAFDHVIHYGTSHHPCFGLSLPSLSFYFPLYSSKNQFTSIVRRKRLHSDVGTGS